MFTQEGHKNVNAVKIDLELTEIDHANGTHMRCTQFNDLCDHLHTYNYNSFRSTSSLTVGSCSKWFIVMICSESSRLMNSCGGVCSSRACRSLATPSRVPPRIVHDRSWWASQISNTWGGKYDHLETNNYKLTAEISSDKMVFVAQGRVDRTCFDTWVKNGCISAHCSRFIWWNYSLREAREKESVFDSNGQKYKK